MKIILEFGETETEQAELSYKGPQFASAVEDFRNHLRSKIKYGQHSEETHKALEDIQEDFYNIFSGLIND
jgi:hypothetical protein